MEVVRIGIVGIGAMGIMHAQNLLAGKVPRAKLSAVCDPKAARLDRFPSAQPFLSVDDFLRSSETDAILIATPHYSHTTIGIAALETGKHVLIEKPISVHKADAERLIAAHRASNQVFAAMFNQRTDPFFLKLRHLVRSGELGAVRRVHWTISNWFRTEAYYRSSHWKATWAGEGGGVLLEPVSAPSGSVSMDLWYAGCRPGLLSFWSVSRYRSRR